MKIKDYNQKLKHYNLKLIQMMRQDNPSEMN